ncbi:MAG: EamA family transporter, partial [Burkholderiaceae bacterium]
FGARIVRHQWLGATISASGVVRVVAGLAYVAILPSLAADWCWDRGAARASAFLPMIFANRIPVFAAFLGFFFLAKPIAWFHLAGGAPILAGILSANRIAMA